MFKSLDKDAKKRNLREGLPAYAYSRYLYIYFVLNNLIYLAITNSLVNYYSIRIWFFYGITLIIIIV